MDTTKTITHVSLCAGYGGIDLGLKRAIPNLRTIAFSEIEAFACANLVSKMEAGLLDAAPVWTNLKTFPWGKFRDRVDILSGGYPCQPFSAAGKRLGTEDPRHLWPYIADGIAAMRPSVCFFENVEGHISLGLPDVIEDLGRLGYRTTWGIFSASEVGAPHQRKRVFIMAHRKCEGLERFNQWNSSTESPEVIGADFRASSFINMVNTINNEWGNVSRNKLGEEKQPKSSNPSLMAHTMCNGGREGREVQQGADGTIPISNGEPRGTWPSRPGQPQFSWEPPRVVAQYENQGDVWWQWGESHADEESGENRRQKDVQRRQIEPSMGGDLNGSSCGVGHAELYVTCDNRTDELRLLGNGVVPATAEFAWTTLLKELTNL